MSTIGYSKYKNKYIITIKTNEKEFILEENEIINPEYATYTCNSYKIINIEDLNKNNLDKIDLYEIDKNYNDIIFYKLNYESAYNDNLLYKTDIQKFVGFYRNYHHNGALSEEYYHNNGIKEGKYKKMMIFLYLLVILYV